MNKIYFLFFLFLNSLLFAFHPPNSISVFIAHTNDIQGDIQRDEMGNGGIANLYTIVNEMRKNGECDLLIDTGNLINPEEIHNERKFKLLLKILSKIGYNMLVPGENELHLNDNKYYQLKKSLKAPFLTCNIKKIGKYELNMDYIIKDIHSIKIAFIGIAYDINSHTKSTNDKTYFLQIKKRLKEIINEVKNKSDFIIVLSSNGIENDIQLMKDFPEVKLIIARSKNKKSEDPIVNRKGQIFVSTNCCLQHLGYIELIFDPRGNRYAGYHYRWININRQKPNKISKLIKKYVKI